MAGPSPTEELTQNIVIFFTAQFYVTLLLTISHMQSSYLEHNVCPFLKLYWTNTVMVCFWIFTMLFFLPKLLRHSIPNSFWLCLPSKIQFFSASKERNLTAHLRMHTSHHTAKWIEASLNDMHKVMVHETENQQITDKSRNYLLHTRICSASSKVQRLSKVQKGLVIIADKQI